MVAFILKQINISFMVNTIACIIISKASSEQLQNITQKTVATRSYIKHVSTQNTNNYRARTFHTP